MVGNLEEAVAAAGLILAVVVSRLAALGLAAAVVVAVVAVAASVALVLLPGWTVRLEGLTVELVVAAAPVSWTAAAVLPEAAV